MNWSLIFIWVPALLAKPNLPDGIRRFTSLAYSSYLIYGFPKFKRLKSTFRAAKKFCPGHCSAHGAQLYGVLTLDYRMPHFLSEGLILVPIYRNFYSHMLVLAAMLFAPTIASATAVGPHPVDRLQAVAWPGLQDEGDISEIVDQS